MRAARSISRGGVSPEASFAAVASIATGTRAAARPAGYCPTTAGSGGVASPDAICGAGRAAGRSPGGAVSGAAVVPSGVTAGAATLAGAGARGGAAGFSQGPIRHPTWPALARAEVCLMLR